MRLRIVGLCVLAALLPAELCVAATRNVPGSYATIQLAIDACVPGDIVLVAPGTYNERIDFKGKTTITVRSSGGPAVTTINGAIGGNGSVVSFKTSEDFTSVLEGFTLTGGTGTSNRGGGIYISLASPTIRYCIIKGNSAQQGAGLYTTIGNPTLLNCLFTGNNATVSGGGIWSEFSSVSMMNCTMTGDTSPSGDATYARGGNITIINSIIWGYGNDAFKGPVGETKYPDVSYSAVQTGATFNTSSNIITSDPQFTNAAMGDFTLLATSPCIDRGNSMALTNGVFQTLIVNNPIDLAGNDRGTDTPNVSNLGVAAFKVVVDIGAYEFQPEGCPDTTNDCPSDISPPGGDGQVSIADVLEVLNHFGTTCP